MFCIYMRRNSEIPMTANPANLPAENSEVLERSSVIDAQAGITQNCETQSASHDDNAKPNVDYGNIVNYS